MHVKYEHRYGSRQCGSMMSETGEGWDCCTLIVGHPGTHFNDIGWKPEWADHWAEPVYHDRCMSWDGNVRCTRTISGHDGLMHRSGVFSNRVWGPVPLTVTTTGWATGTGPRPARTHAQRKKGRRGHGAP